MTPLSLNGRRLASGGHDATVSLSGQSARQVGQGVLVLRGHQGAVWSVAWSPDNRRLASSGVDQSVRTRDASPGYEPVDREGSPGPQHSRKLSAG